MIYLYISLIVIVVMALAISCYSEKKIGVVELGLFNYCIFIAGAIIYFSMVDSSAYSQYKIYNADKDTMIIVSLMQIIGLLIGLIAAKVVKIKNNQTIQPRLKKESIQLLIILQAIYVMLRLALYPDHPIIYVFTGDTNAILRDIAFEYASNRDAPLLFQPSFFNMVIRYALPLTIIFQLSANKDYFTNTNKLILLIAIILLLTSFKRFPIIIASMMFCVYYFNKHKKIGKIFVLGSVSLLAVIIMTFLTKSTSEANVNDLVFSIYERAFIVEGISDAMIVSMKSVQPSLTGISYILNYFARLWDESAISPSMLLKESITYGDTRGYDAISIFAELWLIMSWASIPFISLITFFLKQKTDRLASEYASSNMHGVWAIMTVSISLVFIKGLMSSLISGGILAGILILYALSKKNRPNEK